MSSPTRFSAAAVLALGAAAATQVPPPPGLGPPQARPAQIPDRYEQLPAQVRARLDKLMTGPLFQAVVVVGRDEGSHEPQMVEAGQLITRQTVKPARAVRLTSAPSRGLYGPVGSILWQAREGNTEYWCWRDQAKLDLAGNVYCYLDSNKDGVFDALYENVSPGNQTQFQTFVRGKDEGLKAPVSYEPAPAPEFNEIAGIRYKGVHAGLISDDGKIRPGQVHVQFVVGSNPKNMRVVFNYAIPLDYLGHGEADLPNGYHIEVDDVEVGGRARIQVIGGIPEGEGYAFPPLTPDRVMQLLRQRAGAPRR
jgi:hypothetical protein